MYGRKRDRVGPFLLWFSMFLPLGRGFFHSTNNAAIFSVVVCCTVACVALLCRPKKMRVPSVLLPILLSFFLVLFLSLYYESSLFRLASDSIRLVVFCVFSVIGFNYYDGDSEDLARLIQSIALWQVLLSTMVLFEWINPVTDLFKMRMSTDAVPLHFERFSGAFGFPTDLACFLVLALLVTMVSPSLRSSKFAVVNLAFMIFGLAMTASRGALVLIIGALLFFSLYKSIALISGMAFAPTFKKRSLLIFFLFLCGSFGALLSPNADYMVTAIGAIDSSARHRLNEVYLSYQVLSGQLDVPVGTLRAQPFGLDTVESFVAASVMKFGWFGILNVLLLIFCFIGAFLFIPPVSRKQVAGAVLLWFVAVYFFVQPFNEVIFRVKGSVIYGLLFGMTLAAAFSTLRGGQKHGAIRQSLALEHGEI